MVCDDCELDKDDVKEQFIGDYDTDGTQYFRNLCDECYGSWDMPDTELVTGEGEQN